MYAVSANGQFGAWEWDTDLSDLQSFVPSVHNRESDTTATARDEAVPSTSATVSASASAMHVDRPEGEPEPERDQEAEEEVTRVPTSPEDEQS